MIYLGLASVNQEAIQSVNYYAVCKTAPAKLGLFKNYLEIFYNS